MKVLLINGSPRKNMSTYTALNIVAETLNKEGIDTEIVWVGNTPLVDCIACRRCREIGKCVFDDDCVNAIAEKVKEADGYVFGSPVYYSHPSGQILSLLDRLFTIASPYMKYKPGAAIVCARRAGTSSSLDALTKHFLINEMPVVSSSYWNMIHGSKDEMAEDAEGVQTMRNVAHNMAWLLKCIAAGKESGLGLPASEYGSRTDFIH